MDWAASITQRAADDEQARLVRMAEAWQAYDGDLPLPLKPRTKSRSGRRTGSNGFNPKEPTGPGASDDNILVGWSREIVDTGVAYLFKGDIGFDVAGDNDTTTEAQAWLDQLWAANRKMTTLMDLGLNGGVCGHAFLRIAPQVAGGNTESYRAAPDQIRVVVLDPANVRVTWADDDISRAIGYTVEYSAIVDGKPLLRRQTITVDGHTLDDDDHVIGPGGQSWTITDWEQRHDAADWALVGEPQTWPWPWPPIIDCKNLPRPNEYYGGSDLDDVIIRINKAANARASDLARTHRMHAHPQAWAKGMTGDQVQFIELGIDRIIGLPNPDAELQFLELKNSSPSVDLDFLKWLKVQAREAARIPEIAAGAVDAGVLSGVALNIMFQPLIAKTEAKRRSYGDMLADLNSRLLELGGFGRLPVTLRWPELLPGDPKAEVEVAMGKQAVGVSKDTILGELGYDPDEEASRRELDAEAVERGLNDGRPFAGDTTL